MQDNRDWNITPNEQEVINVIRSLEPYERVEIMADNSGRLDYYIVVRTKKMILTAKGKQHLQ